MKPYIVHRSPLDGIVKAEKLAKLRADPLAMAKRRMRHLKIEIVKSPLAWKGGNFIKWDSK